MTDAEQVIQQMEVMFPDQIASWEHSPVVFNYQIKLAVWMLEKAQDPKPEPVVTEAKPE